jgi:hypothetical protein
MGMPIRKHTSMVASRTKISIERFPGQSNGATSSS